MPDLVADTPTFRKMLSMLSLEHTDPNSKTEIKNSENFEFEIKLLIFWQNMKKYF